MTDSTDIAAQPTTEGDDEWIRGGRLFDTFLHFANDDWDAPKAVSRLMDDYDDSIPQVQGIINWVVMAFCGYSVPTLRKAAACDSPEDVETSSDFPLTPPMMVEGITGDAAEINELFSGYRARMASRATRKD